MADMEWIGSEADALKSQLIRWRRDFHRYAELGWLEMRTTSIVARILYELGYELQLGRTVCQAEARMGLPSEVQMEEHYAWARENGADQEFLPYAKGGFTGVVATLHCGDGPTVALRFDMDALGVSESCNESHFPFREGFRSVTEGVMHACGHDGHTAIGLGTATLLSRHREKLKGTIKLIFQPAEEGVRGAEPIVEAGHLAHVDFALAAHIFPKARGGRDAVAVLPDGLIGGLATTKLDLVFHGKPAHAGISPQEGHNALIAAATAVLNLHAIPRFGNVPTRINVGTLSAGTGRNVICDRAKIEMEVRGATVEANDYMESRALQIARGAASMQGCELDIFRMGAAMTLENSPELSALVKKVCAQQLGLNVIESTVLGGGSEDYSFFSRRVIKGGGQSAYVGLLTTCPQANHSDEFDFDEGILSDGVKLFCGMACSLLNAETKKQLQQ